MELESVWLLIGFFVFVALCAAAAMLLLLRQYNYGLPPNSTQVIMLVMLLITLIISLLIAVGLYRISSGLSAGPEPAPGYDHAQHMMHLPEQAAAGTHFSLSE